MEAAAASGLQPGEDTSREDRVLVTAKKQVTEQINKYKDILRTALDGQRDVSLETKRVLLQELLAASKVTRETRVLRRRRHNASHEQELLHYTSFS